MKREKIKIPIWAPVVLLSLGNVLILPLSANEGANTSASIAVCATPKQSRYWHSMPGETAQISISWPENAENAVLTIAGMKERASMNVTRPTRSVTFTRLSPPDTKFMSSDVYQLTLSFDDGTTHTATVGNTGGINGAPLRVLAAEDFVSCTNSKAWSCVQNSAVLPVPADAAQLRIDGVARALPEEESWYAWSPTGKGIHHVSLEEFTAILKRKDIGFFILLQ